MTYPAGEAMQDDGKQIANDYRLGAVDVVLMVAVR
jgi:hypothetical protein